MRMTNTKSKRAEMRRRRIAYLRGKLLEKRQKLLETMMAGINSAIEPSGVPADAADMASSTSAIEDSMRIGAVGSDALAQIDYALRRLESGKYGICADCGKRIPEARLRALPFAYLCVECKEREERESASRQQEETLPDILEDLGSIGTEPAEEEQSPVRAQRL